MKRNTPDDEGQPGFFGSFLNASLSFIGLGKRKKPRWIPLRYSQFPEEPIGGMMSHAQMKTVFQFNEIDSLLRNEEKILEKMANLSEVKTALAALVAVNNTSSNYEQREKALDDLNAAIILPQIAVSKEQGGTALICQHLFLTRLPVKLILEDKEYWSKLERLSLKGNNIIDLPNEITQLSSLKSLNLMGNNVVVLEETLKGLSSLEEVTLPQNVVNHFGENTTFLPSAPLKREPQDSGTGVCFELKEIAREAVTVVPRKTT